MVERSEKCRNDRRLTSESGSITVLFCFVALILVGAISFSLYIGQQVEKKIALQNASDAGAISIANHAAQGLNMIAANNLSIGASIHVAGSVPLLASYASVAYLLSADGWGALTEIAKHAAGAVSLGILKTSNVFQMKIWNKLAVLPAIHMQVATGLTGFNDFLNDWWLLPAPIYGLETVRANIPGSIAVPVQKSRVPIVGFIRFEGLAKTVPQDTICHAIKSSRQMSSRDFLTFLVAPFESLVGGSGDKKSTLEGMINDVFSLLKMGADKLPFGFVDCGYGLKIPYYQFFMNIIDADQGPLAEVAGRAANAVSMNAGEITDIALSFDDGCSGLFAFACKAACTSWEAVASEVASRMLAIFSSNYGRRKSERSMLEELKKSPDASVCYEGPDRVMRKGHVPIATVGEGNGCLSLAEIDPRCAFHNEVRDIKGLYCSGRRENIENWLDQGCAGYYKFAQEEVPENSEGISIVDWGYQAKSYGEGGKGFLSLGGFGITNPLVGGEGKKDERIETLGFLFPKNEQQFLDSIEFINLSANPLRTKRAGDLKHCPKDHKLEDPSGDGTEYCQNTPMVGLALDPSAARDSPIHNKQELRDRFNASTGGLQQLQREIQSGSQSDRGELASTWSKVQWVFSQSKASYVMGTGDPAANTKMSLFWPAWQSQLTHLNMGLVEKLFSNEKQPQTQGAGSAGSVLGNIIPSFGPADAATTRQITGLGGLDL